MKITFFSALLLSGVMIFASCEQAPKSDEAKTSEAKKVDETKTEGASELKVDTKTSEVTWVGTKPVGKHNGSFGVSEGTISLKEGKVAGGSFTIDVKSLKVLDIPAEKEENKKLVGHLLAKDFFEAETFPTAKFTITEVADFKKDEKATNEKKDAEYTLADPTHTVTGNLELKGVTKSVTFPAKITVADGKVDAEAKFNINRKDWNMSYGADESLGDKFIKPTVHIGFKVSASK